MYIQISYEYHIFKKKDFGSNSLHHTEITLLQMCDTVKIT